MSLLFGDLVSTVINYNIVPVVDNIIRILKGNFGILISPFAWIIGCIQRRIDLTKINTFKWKLVKINDKVRKWRWKQLPCSSSLTLRWNATCCTPGASSSHILKPKIKKSLLLSDKLSQYWESKYFFLISLCNLSEQLFDLFYHLAFWRWSRFIYMMT